MAEFVNYKVELQFKDGTKTVGHIAHVDGTQIRVGGVTYPNSLVKDLKVKQLPDKKKEDAKVSRSSTPRLAKQAEFGTSVQAIKAAEDFDFAGQLAKFDKKLVFADFERNDQVLLQDRLVGHNKVDHVKRMKKKDKFDNDEMVLAEKTDNWNSIASLSGRLALPATVAGAATQPAPRELQLFSFKFEDGGAVPLALPVQLVEIERAAADQFGVGTNTLVEICATNLYRLVANDILGGSVRLSNRKNHNLPPLVLLLVGSGRCSSRAFALGRHLTNHGVRVLAYLINAEIADADMLHQCQLFEKAGGKVVNVPFAGLLDILHNQLETPVELIVDALQGFDGHLPDLFYAADAMDSLRRAVRWVNEPRQLSKVLSLDIALGVDGGLGTVLDAALHVHPRYIVSLGLPVTGLLHAYNNGAISEDVTHYVVDAGIPNAVYGSKPHLRKFDKFWFCAEEALRLVVVADLS